MALDFTDLGGGKVSTGGRLDFSDLESPTTPGGVPLTPVTVRDTFTEPDPTVARQAAEDDFAAGVNLVNDLEANGFVIPLPDAPVSLSLSDMLAQETIDAAEQASVLDAERVENVLFDLVPDYQGSNVDPKVLSFGDRDSLSRMPRFEQRQSYFKNKFPRGELFRVDTGDGNLVEMYKTSPNGKAYRVSDDVFSFADIGGGTGAFANFTTAGSVLGSIYSPFVGTAGGAYIGNTIDDAIANFLATPDGEYFSDEKDFKMKFLSGDRVALSLIDATLTKVLPGAGRAGKHMVRQGLSSLERRFAREGETTLFEGQPNASLLYELGVFSTVPKAVDAQKAAQAIARETGVKLPALNISQLSSSQIMRGIASQVSGTADTLPKNLSNQQSKLLQALDAKVQKLGGNLEQLSQEELYNYISLSNKQLADNVFNAFRLNSGGKDLLPDIDDAAAALSASARKFDDGIKNAIDRKYTEAFTVAGIDDVVFDISDLVAEAQRVKAGIPITKQPAGGRTATGKPLDKDKKFATEQTVRTRDFGGDLANITNKLINVFDPKIKNLKAVRGSGEPELISSFRQLKDIRDQLSDLINDGAGGEASKGATDLIKQIDDLILNGIENGKVTGGSDAWRKTYTEAGELVKQRIDAKNFTRVGQLFGRKGEVTPVEVAQNLLDGSLTFETLGILKRMTNTAALNATEKEAGQAFIKNIGDTFASLLIHNPDEGYELISKLKARDKKLFNTLFDKPTKDALNEWQTTGKRLASDPVQTGMEGFQTNGDVARNYIIAQYSKGQTLGVQRFINANGGLSGDRAKQIRSAILADILEKVSQVQREGAAKSFSETVINPVKLAEEMRKFQTFQGEYRAFKPLFGEVDKAGNFVNKKIKRNDDMTFTGTSELDMLQNFKIYAAFLGNTPDIGGAFSTGNIRAKLLDVGTSASVGALKHLFTNKYISKVFAAEPSVEQLERAIKIRSGAAGVRASIALLNRMLDTLNFEVDVVPPDITAPKVAPGQETPTEERERTGTVDMGPMASLSPTLPQIQPSPSPSVGTGITNFANLFPQDELGGAIANRRNQGIRGLV